MKPKMKRQTLERALAGVLLVLGLAVGMAPTAAAYVDPTTTTFLAQALASVAAILGSALVLFWRKMRKRVYRLLGIDENRNKQVEEEFAVLSPEQVAACDEKARQEAEARAAEEERIRRKREEIGAPYPKKLLFSAFACLFLVLTLFFYSPIEVYLGNYHDFYFPLGVLLRSLLPFSLLLGAGIAAAIAAIPGKVWYYVNATVAATGVAFYLQALALNGKMGTLTGEGDTYSAGTVILNLLVWLVVFAACEVGTWWALHKKRPGTFRAVLATAAVLLVLVQSVGLFVQMGQTHADRKTISYRFISNEGQTTLAKRNNVVVFILDTVSGDYVKQALAEDPDLFRELDGFTYYPDAVSSYSRTFPSVPYLLTHTDCNFDLPYATYLKQAYENSTYLSGMKEKGTSIGLYTENYFLDEGILPLLDNYAESKPEYHYGRLISQMGKIASYRNFPYLLKRPFRYEAGEVNAKVYRSGNNHNDAQYERTFYEAVQKEGVRLEKDAEAAFRFFHFEGTHPGARLQADATYAAAPTTTNEILEGELLIIRTYLNALREAGVYDETTVIITADHGYSGLGTGNTSLKMVRNPSMILLVKQKNGHGDCKTSAAPVCHNDLFATVYEGLGIGEHPYGDAIDDVEEGAERTRYYYYSSLFSDEDGEIAKLEFEVKGNASELSSYRFTGRYWDINYSTRAVSRTRFDESLLGEG